MERPVPIKIAVCVALSFYVPYVTAHLCPVLLKSDKTKLQIMNVIETLVNKGIRIGTLIVIT